MQLTIGTVVAVLILFGVATVYAQKVDRYLSKTGRQTKGSSGNGEKACGQTAAEK